MALAVIATIGTCRRGPVVSASRCLHRGQRGGRAGRGLRHGARAHQAGRQDVAARRVHDAGGVAGLREGHSVVTARNGRTGLRLARELRPDLVITDVFMPDVDGLEVVLQLRRELRRPVIVISGGGRPLAFDHLDAARLLGAMRVLTKPFGTQELLAAVREALGTVPS
jgi:CheY-like chemotaxis protein